MKQVRILLSVVLVICMLLSTFPVFALEAGPALEEPVRAINSTIIIDDDASGGYEGDYVVIYNPATSSSTSYSTGTMTGLIETSVGTSSYAQTRQPANSDRPYKIDVDSRLAEYAKTAEIEPAPEGTRASYNVGSTKTFSLDQCANPRLLQPAVQVPVRRSALLHLDPDLHDGLLLPPGSDRFLLCGDGCQ